LNAREKGRVMSFSGWKDPYRIYDRRRRQQSWHRGPE
jgi:hypothetical protein